MAKDTSTFILEGIVTTLDADRRVSISPMGPIVDEPMSRLLLRPFQTSTTFRNLQRSGEGVFHITDDVELLARAAIDRLEVQPQLLPSEAVDGMILSEACRWYAFRVARLDAQQDRAELDCEIVSRGRLRDFSGFNRAKHAVLEAAILATRVQFLPAEHICEELARLAPLVEKTGGPAEKRAFSLLNQYVEETAQPSSPESAGQSV